MSGLYLLCFSRFVLPPPSHLLLLCWITSKIKEKDIWLKGKNVTTTLHGLVVVMTYGTHLSIVILLCRKFICSAEIVVLCSHLLPHLHPHVFFISRYISLLFQNYDLKLCNTINNMLVSLVYEVIHSNTNFQHLSHFSIWQITHPKGFSKFPKTIYCLIHTELSSIHIFEWNM